MSSVLWWGVWLVLDTLFFLVPDADNWATAQQRQGKMHRRWREDWVISCFKIFCRQPGNERYSRVIKDVETTVYTILCSLAWQLTLLVQLKPPFAPLLKADVFKLYTWKDDQETLKKEKERKKLWSFSSYSLLLPEMAFRGNSICKWQFYVLCVILELHPHNFDGADQLQGRYVYVIQT